MNFQEFQKDAGIGLTESPHERDIDIQSAFHGVEKRTGKYEVDGFANAKVFEFYGDFYFMACSS